MQYKQKLYFVKGGLNFSLQWLIARTKTMNYDNLPIINLSMARFSLTNLVKRLDLVTENLSNLANITKSDRIANFAVLKKLVP